MPKAHPKGMFPQHFEFIDRSPLVMHPISAEHEVDQAWHEAALVGAQPKSGVSAANPSEEWDEYVKSRANPKQAYGDKKIPVHLVPPAASMYLAMAFKEGARKYGAYNWRENDVEAMTYVGAALRHIMQYLDGEDIDPDTGEAEVPHLAAAGACLAILADATEGDNLIDNRPPTGPASLIIQEKQL